MLTHIAVVPYQIAIDPSTLTRVAAALQRQVSQDFGPVWQVEATVSPFVDWNSVPADYARVILVDHLDSGSLGVHADRNGQPYALVAAHGDWPLVASHECLEMLADPTGKRTLDGPSPKDGSAAELLVEVCDPCQGKRWAYAIDGIPVSDFCTPAFYDGSGDRWSFRGNITGPRQILRDGYVSWHDPAAQEWWRRDWLGSKITDYALGPLPPNVSFLRGGLDRMARQQRAIRKARFVDKPSKSAKAKARVLAGEVDKILDGGAKPRRRAKGRA